MVRRGIELVAIGLWVGCSFDSSSLGGGTSGSTGTAGAGSGEPAESSAAGSSSGDPGSAGDTGADEPMAMVRVEPAMLDFGPQALPGPGVATIVLHNDGDAAATDLQALVDDDGFAFAGGTYPGTAGDCGARLEPAASCTVELAFEPTELGRYLGTLRIRSADEPEIAVDLRGLGAGSTGNLIGNGDAELAGAPPPSWTALGGEWTTTATFVYAGALSFTAGLSPAGAVEVAMEQAVDLSALDRAVDVADGISFALSARARSAVLEDNDFRIVLVWRDAEAGELGRDESDWATTADWVAVVRTQVPPVGTRSALVQLQCRKTEGMFCDAFFDDVSLVGTVPVPED